MPFWRFRFNSLWPSDAMWWHRSKSTSDQVMPCFLTAPSHYLNQCWFIIGAVLWYFTCGHFQSRFRQWHVAWSAPNHYSNQWWLTYSQSPRIEFRWKYTKLSVTKMHLIMSSAIRPYLTMLKTSSHNHTTFALAMWISSLSPSMLPHCGLCPYMYR